MIEIENSGPKILRTNYWQSDYARNGIIFLSFNAKTARLLLPPEIQGLGNRKDIIKEIKTTKYVIISSGLMTTHQREGYELVFEDFTSSPLFLMFGEEQTDRKLLDTDQGKGITLDIYTENGIALTKPARYRKVDTLPCQKEWTEQ